MLILPIFTLNLIFVVGLIAGNPKAKMGATNFRIYCAGMALLWIITGYVFGKSSNTMDGVIFYLNQY